MTADEPGLPDLTGLEILLAEDNPTNQMVATEMLRAMGARVDVAADGAEALEMLVDRLYDVLIVDIEMPRISGLDVIRAVRASDGPVARRPLLALTAWPREEHGGRILEAGADAVISKPIEGIASLGRAVLDGCAARSGGAARTGGTLHGDGIARHADGAPGEPGDRPPCALRAAAARGEGLRGAILRQDAPGAPGGDAPGAVDEAALAALLAAVGPEMQDPLLARLIDDVAAGAAAIGAAADARDAEAMRRATHALSAVAGTAGCARLHRQATDLNALARAGRMEETRGIAPALQREAEGLIARLADARGRA